MQYTLQKKGKKRKKMSGGSSKFHQSKFVLVNTPKSVIINNFCNFSVSLKSKKLIDND